MKAVTICIPTYNGARYLQQTLDSVCAQTYGDFDAIVVDDGSADATVAIASEYSRRDSRIRVMQNPTNLGLVGNWNRCIELAATPWIKFVFQDDILRPYGLATLLATADRHRAALAFGRREFLYDNATTAETVERYEAAAKRISALYPEDGLVDAGTFSRLVLEHHGRNIVGEPVAVLLRRDVFDQVGRFHGDVAVFCDMEFWARVGTNFGVAHSTATVADFRVHGESTTARSTAGDHFRMFVLDPLVVLHDMAHDEVYEALRKVAATEGIDLAKRFAATAHWARGEARRMALDLTSPDRKPLDQLDELARCKPRLRQVLEQPLEQPSGLAGLARRAHRALRRIIA